MKIEYKVESTNLSSNRFHSIELDNYGYFDEVVRDLEKVIEFHRMRNNEIKTKYLKEYGQEAFDIIYKRDKL